MLDAMELSGTRHKSSPIHAAFTACHQELLNLCETLSSSREGMMNKKPKRHLFWSLKRSGMRFLMKPLSLESDCQRSNWGKC